MKKKDRDLSDYTRGRVLKRCERAPTTKEPPSYTRKGQKGDVKTRGIATRGEVLTAEGNSRGTRIEKEGALKLQLRKQGSEITGEQAPTHAVKEKAKSSTIKKKNGWSPSAPAVHGSKRRRQAVPARADIKGVSIWKEEETRKERRGIKGENFTEKVLNQAAGE